MVGTGKDDARLAIGASGFEKIVKTDDVAAQDPLKRTFDRRSTKMDDTVAAGDHGIHRLSVGKIALDELLMVSWCSKTCAIRKADRVGQATEPCAHHTAKLTRSASDEKAFHSRSSH